MKSYLNGLICFISPVIVLFVVTDGKRGKSQRFNQSRRFDEFSNSHYTCCCKFVVIVIGRWECNHSSGDSGYGQWQPANVKPGRRTRASCVKPGTKTRTRWMVIVDSTMVTIHRWSQCRLFRYLSFCTRGGHRSLSHCSTTTSHSKWCSHVVSQHVWFPESVR